MIAKHICAAWLMIIFAALAPVHSAPLPSKWNIGDERELIPGSHVRLFAEFEGWRIWRAEIRTGVFCKAVKPPQSAARPPEPLDGFTFIGSDPALMVFETTSLPSLNEGRATMIIWGMTGQHPYVQTQEFRLDGEKFFTERPSSIHGQDKWNELLLLDGKTVEVHVTSWRYRTIAAGYSEKTDKISLIGLSKAIESLKHCALSK